MENSNCVTTIEDIARYLTYQEGRWASTTLISERARLNASFHLLLLSPEEAYRVAARRLSPYSLKTTFIRIADFKAWQGDLNWRAWIKGNTRLFKNAYKKERIEYDFDEISKKLDRLRDSEVRDCAWYLLQTGLRISEAESVVRDQVCGKGGKVRKVYVDRYRTLGKISVTQRQIRYALKQQGLKPHQLRKAFATRLVNAGFKEAELMEVMGWSSIQTATSYIQPMKENELKQRVQDAIRS